MVERKRMSPWTALFLGMFGVGAVGIAAGTSIVLYTMRVADNGLRDVFGIAESTIDGLPELIDSLPPAAKELLNDRRAPDYASQLDVDVRFVSGSKGRGSVPAIKITNNGDEVVSMLAVRIAALNQHGTPIKEWTEVVATPVAIDHDWRGVLMPGATRHVVFSGWHGIDVSPTEIADGAYEISEIRLWQQHETTTVAHAAVMP